MSNYYVRRSGEDDYLEHAFPFGIGGGAKKGSTWKNHKYLAKLNVGGHVRYIYNQAQLAAARGGSAIANVRRHAGRAITGARQAFDRVTGLADRRAMNVNRARAKSLKPGYGRHLARKNAKSHEQAYNKSLFGRIENAGNKARNLVGQAAGQARAAGANFAGSIKRGAYAVDKAVGISARNKMVKAKKTKDARSRVASDAIKQNTSVKDKALRNAKIAGRQYRHARHDYNRSLLGRAEGAFNDARDWLDERTHPLRAKAKGARRKLKKKSKNAYLGFKNVTTGKKT